MGREAAESLHHRPDAAATAAAAAILMKRSGCTRLFPPGRRSRGEAPRALIPPPSALLPPSASLRTHAAHPAGAARWPPSLSSSVRPPRPGSTPSARSPTPPSPDLCQQPEGKRAAGRRGGSRVNGRWRRPRAGSAHSPAPAGWARRGPSTSAGSRARLPRFAARLSVPAARPAAGRFRVDAAAGARLSPRRALREWNSPACVLT